MIHNEKKVRTHKDLDLWKAAMKLARNTYLATAGFPKEEIYGLTSVKVLRF